MNLCHEPIYLLSYFIILVIKMQCQICCTNNDKLYSISGCQHSFCLDCCMNHISSKSQLFIQILCPDTNCKKPFNAPQQIMSRMPVKVLENLNKRNRYDYLIKNPHIKQCSIVNCQGLIDTKQSRRVCNSCSTPHCPKCMKPFHTGPCLMNEEDQEMRKFYYQKCPKCSAWVEKKEGCNYVDCKCGTNFCYTCGIEFQSDPCRLKQKFEIQDTIRRVFKQIKIDLPSQKSKCLLEIVKLPFKIVVLMILTIFFSLLFNALIIIILAFFIVLSPIFILILACTELDQIYIKILVIVFLPLLTALLILLIIMSFALYPCLRKTAHHGIYDGFDFVVNNCIKIYCGMIRCIL